MTALVALACALAVGVGAGVTVAATLGIVLVAGVAANPAWILAGALLLVLAVTSAAAATGRGQ